MPRSKPKYMPALLHSVGRRFSRETDVKTKTMRILHFVGRRFSAPELRCKIKTSLGILRPNVLLMIVDDLSVNAVSSYPSAEAAILQTPNMAALAARSIQFNNALCQQAMCGPSRTSFLTSRRPDITGKDVFR